MEEIRHRTLKVNGINMHVAEKGTDGPVILFIHGFPELWYTWRHQIDFVASRGYRAVAPDLRGYGDTEVPAETEAYTCFHVVGDMVALIDEVAGETEKVYVVGHDWGAIIAWFLCLLRPDRVKALVNMSVAFIPRNPKFRPVQALRFLYGDDYYICRFQEPREIETEFAEYGTERVMKEIFSSRNPNPGILPKGQGFGASKECPAVPSWLSNEEMTYFINKFEKTGFSGAINYYRNIDRNWELSAPWSGAQVKVPVKFIVGDCDLAYTGVKDYVQKGGLKRDVPLLEELVVMEGVGHFINQEKAHEINQHIFHFFSKFESTVFE